MRPSRRTSRPVSASPASPARRALATSSRVLRIAVAVAALAAIGCMSAASSADVGRHTAPASAIVPDVCTPQTYNWTFNAGNNYAAPSPGERYVETADGCQSVWYVGSLGAVTLNVHVAENSKHGAFETTPVTCKPNVVCQLWNPAETTSSSTSASH